MYESQNPKIDKFHVVQKRRGTDFEALKLRKGSSGIVDRSKKLRLVVGDYFLDWRATA